MHLQSDVQLTVTRASSQSFWFDKWWYEDNPLGGAKGLAINWFKLFSDDDLQDPRCLALINSARRIVHALLYPETIKRRSLETVYGGYARKIIYLVWWMYGNKVWRFADLTPEIADRYISDLIEAKASTPDDDVDPAECVDTINAKTDEMGVATLSAHFRALTLVFELSHEFELFPDLQIREHPFRGQSAQSLAETMAVATEGWIPRVPDALLNRIMHAVLQWIDVRAADILFAQDTYFEAMNSRPDYLGKNHHEFTAPPLKKICFDGRGSQSEPWRPPLHSACSSPTIELRKLINDLEAASAICIQAVTGIRVSEFLAAKVEPRQPNGWPACLVMKTSQSGLYDLFYFSSRTFKPVDDEEGAEMEWLIGVRPAGAESMPIAARAILVLDKLFDPWREQFNTDYLTLSLGAGEGLPKTKRSQIKPLDTRLANVSREFLRRHVVFPEEFSDWIITTHQYRKAFCQDIVRINPGALTAVQEHYGHTSHYITDEAYAGNDTRMLRMIDDVATREAAKMIVERIYAGSTLAGKMASVVDRNEGKIRKMLEGESTDERRTTALANALSVEGIKLFTSDYIDCLFRGEHAMCHREAIGRFDPAAVRPLRAYRSKKNCSTCANGVINRHHIPYWIQDYRLNEQIRKANEDIGDERTATVASVRAAQAKSVLKRFGSWPIRDLA